MNRLFISSLKNTLEKSLILLENMPESAYVDDSVGPFIPVLEVIFDIY